MQIMHALHKLTLSTSKMAEGVKEDVHFRRFVGGEDGGGRALPTKKKKKKRRCALAQRNCVLFCLVIVLREKNQAQLKLFLF